MAFLSKKEKDKQKRIAMAREALRLNNIQKKEKPNEGRKLTHRQLLEIVPFIKEVEDFWIRNPEEYKSTSFNYIRQVKNFVWWLLCKYRVPPFMYDLFLKPIKSTWRAQTIYGNNVRQLYLDWFITIGQGFSFVKASKNIFSRREASLFLKAPDNYNINECVLWAKCVSHNIPMSITAIFCESLVSKLPIIHRDLWDQALTFYARYPEIDKHTLQDTFDFISNRLLDEKHNRINFPNMVPFTLFGRTLNSVIQLTNEWHRLLNLKKNIGENISWDGILVPNWKYEEEEGLNIWCIEQILSSQQLFSEGKVMKHCVGSYATQCYRGQIGIFSMTHQYYGSKSRILTIEVNSNKTILQVRGKMNRKATARELKILNRWANELNLNFGNYI